MLRFGPDGGPTVVVALPLLEEANRTRAFAVTLLRLLAARGIGGALPDLPGTGESLGETADMTLENLRAAFAIATSRCGDRSYAVAIRSGALLDASAPVRGRWHLAPSDGATTLREWRRIAAMGADGPGDPPQDLVEVAGNPISRTLLEELREDAPPGDAHGSSRRVVRMEGDARPADRIVAGSPLWRRAEPGNDLALAALLADDIADWIATCEA